MIAAVVPVKALARSKSRLLPHLPREAVARLAVAMMGDVVEALRSVSALARVAVVTPDAKVAAAAEAAGAEPLLRRYPGLNEALDGSAAELCRDPRDGVLVVLGDVAGVRPRDLELLLASLDAAGGCGVALAPSRDGGTSALLRVPWDAIPAGFGPDSAAVHRERAECAGVPFREVDLPSLAIDVDEREDLDAILRSAAVGARTRALLESLR